MPEYIVSEPLKKEIADFKHTVKCDNSDYLTGYICALSAVEEMIAEQPAADVQPVKHGRWMCGDSRYPYCSECRRTLITGIVTEYCPRCGAKMNKNGR